MVPVHKGGIEGYGVEVVNFGLSIKSTEKIKPWKEESQLQEKSPLVRGEVRTQNIPVESARIHFGGANRLEGPYKKGDSHLGVPDSFDCFGCCFCQVGSSGLGGEGRFVDRGPLGRAGCSIFCVMIPR